MAAKLVRWNPFMDLAHRREDMDRLFEEFFLPSRLWEKDASGPRIDILQDDKAITVKASLPGVKPDDVDIHLSGDTLTIRAETREEKETKESNYLMKELSYGEFSRTVTLPVAIMADKAEASMDDGMLTLVLPKQETTKARKIKVAPKPALKAAKKK